MSAAEAEAVGRPGEISLLRGGREGDTYWTTERRDTVEEAAARLALLSPPEVRVEFRMLGEPELIKEGSPTRAAYGQPGGGPEYISRDRVEVEVIAVDDLE